MNDWDFDQVVNSMCGLASEYDEVLPGTLPLELSLMPDFLDDRSVHRKLLTDIVEATMTKTNSLISSSSRESRFKNTVKANNEESKRFLPIINLFCPWCGCELVLRTNSQTGTKFFGCSGFPQCRFSCSIEEVQIAINKIVKEV